MVQQLLSAQRTSSERLVGWLLRPTIIVSAASKPRELSSLHLQQKQRLPHLLTQAPLLQCKCYSQSSEKRNHPPRQGPPQASSSSTTMALYNSLTEQVEPLLAPPSSAAESQGVKGIACYTCGPTVYAPAHLGHARTYVWLDILRRCLEHQAAIHQQPSPLFVMNITDVDDKILNEAARKKNKEMPLQLARRFEAEFWNDWDALHCLRPHVVTRVTEHVESDIVPYIERLVDQGMAYQIGTNYSDDDNDESSPTAYGGIYFDVRAYEERMGTVTRYGKLAPPSISSDFYNRQPQVEQQLEGEHDTVAATPKTRQRTSLKRDKRDFALWKKRKSGEVMYWSSPWGDGRPGWHIECSAMIEAVQKQFESTHTFTLHAGGVDLKFPHHTNEIAQAEAYRFNNKTESSSSSSSATAPWEEWIRHWIHTGHLLINGQKMSKSLRNYVTVKTLISEVPTGASGAGLTSTLWSPADDFRLWCLGLSGAYRSRTTYSAERIKDSRVIRNKIVNFLLSGEEWLRRREEVTPDDGTDTVASTKWSVEDYALFVSVNDAAAKSRRALLFDLDGSTYVDQLVWIAEEGMFHLGREAAAKGSTEPIRAALSVLRDLLSLVGFSDATCRAGMMTSVTKTDDDRRGVVGGDRALIDELAKFRSAVRRAAIDDHKDENTTTSDSMKHILKLCDDARDKVFPALGVELKDGRVAVDIDEKKSFDDWSFCVPRSSNVITSNIVIPKSKRIAKAIKSGNFQTVPPEVLFRLGPYEGLFSTYDDEGFPTGKVDGSAISNTQLKKMRKVLAKHIKGLEKRRRTKVRLESKKDLYAHRRELRARMAAKKKAEARVERNRDSRDPM